MENIIGNIQKNRERILLWFAIFVFVLYCVLSAQWALALAISVIAAIFAVAIPYLNSHGPETADHQAWVMIACAVIVALMASVMAPWLVWAVAFAVMFWILLVLVQIEKRLAMLECRGTRRDSRRRMRGGAGPRHRP
jgi:hypothetical protein